MISPMQMAIIRKDLKSILSNKRLLTMLIIVPFVFSAVLPTVFIVTINFDTSDSLKQLTALLPESMQDGDMKGMAMRLLMNSIMPSFFMLIPIMASSVMAASSFVGEKEKRTLETLLYCPLSLKEMFQAKVLASFALSMAASFISFAFMASIVEIESLALSGEMIPFGLGWPICILIASPSASFIAITMIVRGSAKAKTIEESQQAAVFLILPIIALIIGQFANLLFISEWFLLAFGCVLAFAAFLLMRGSLKKFTYEALLG